MTNNLETDDVSSFTHDGFMFVSVVGPRVPLSTFHCDITCRSGVSASLLVGKY